MVAGMVGHEFRSKQIHQTECNAVISVIPWFPARRYPDSTANGSDPDPNGNADPTEAGENDPTNFTSLLDSDSDGVPDYIEGNDDRDDDDIPNALDYDTWAISSL